MWIDLCLCDVFVVGRCGLMLWIDVVICNASKNIKNQ